MAEANLIYVCLLNEPFLMKIFHILLFLSVFLPLTTRAQTIDTLLTIEGGYQLHFNVIKGKNAPVLFETGAGNNGDIWKKITRKIAKATGASIITYDRLAYSENATFSPIGFAKEIEALENGLQQLGFEDQKIMLVSHSMGGMYNSYFASRHPNEVKSAVFIDISTPCAWAYYFNDPDFFKGKDDRIAHDIKTMMDSVNHHPMPLHIPVLDIVAEKQLDDNGKIDTVNAKIWFDCHNEFVALSPQRKLLMAIGSRHYVFLEKKKMVIKAIIDQYSTFIIPEK